jgi:hypothetical protein
MVAIGRVSRTAPLRWTRRSETVRQQRTESAGHGFPEMIAGLPAVIESADDGDRALRPRPAAPFVAQLIANRFNLAQTRRHRTACSQEAGASYLSADPDRRGTDPGCLVRRDI